MHEEGQRERSHDGNKKEWEPFCWIFTVWLRGWNSHSGLFNIQSSSSNEVLCSFLLRSLRQTHALHLYYDNIISYTSRQTSQPPSALMFVFHLLVRICFHKQPETLPTTNYSYYLLAKEMGGGRGICLGPIIS